jgi:hypothetical protein
MFEKALQSHKAFYPAFMVWAHRVGGKRTQLDRLKLENQHLSLFSMVNHFVNRAEPLHSVIAVSAVIAVMPVGTNVRTITLSQIERRFIP